MAPVRFCSSNLLNSEAMAMLGRQLAFRCTQNDSAIDR
jgi:hypothetical protein